jgi:hypothetical protein
MEGLQAANVEVDEEGGRVGARTSKRERVGDVEGRSVLEMR